MRIDTISRTTIYLTLDDDTELELDHQPIDYSDPLVTEVGDHIVVSYLTYDDTGWDGNPFTDSGEFEWEDLSRGRLYGSSTPWSNASEALDEAWAEYEEDRQLESGEIESRWDFDNCPPEWGNDIIFRVFSHTPTEYKYAFRSNFDTTRPWISLVTDPDDLESVHQVLTISAKCVEGMPKSGENSVDALVQAMLDEYTAMIHGEVYGCITHVYNSHGTMIDDMDHNEAVWGYIGDKYAEESLADMHTTMVGSLKNNDEED